MLSSAEMVRIHQFFLWLNDAKSMKLQKKYMFCGIVPKIITTLLFLQPVVCQVVVLVADESVDTYTSNPHAFASRG